MPGAHTYIYSTLHLNLIFTLHHGPGSWTLQEKGKVTNRRTGRLCRPVLQLPTGQFSQLANMLVRSWRTWNEEGANKMNRTGARTCEGQWGWHGKGEQAHSLQNKALQADTAGGLSARHRPPNKQPAVGRPHSQKQQPQTMSACLSSCSAGRWGERSGAGSQEGGCRPT